MYSYKVSFFKKADPNKQDSEDEFLGSVVVDDFGLDSGLTIVGKAFRQANPNSLVADKTVTVRL